MKNQLKQVLQEREQERIAVKQAQLNEVLSELLVSNGVY